MWCKALVLLNAWNALFLSSLRTLTLKYLKTTSKLMKTLTNMRPGKNQIIKYLDLTKSGVTAPYKTLVLACGITFLLSWSQSQNRKTSVKNLKKASYPLIKINHKKLLIKAYKPVTPLTNKNISYRCIPCFVLWCNLIFHFLIAF